MSVENPFSSPEVSGDTQQDDDPARVARAYARLIGQARPAVLLVALISAGFAALCLISFLLGVNELNDQYAIDLEFAALDRDLMWMTFWKFVQMALLAYVAFRLFIVAGMMSRVVPGEPRSVLRLLAAEIRLWWTMAVCSTLIIFGSMALALYLYEFAP